MRKHSQSHVTNFLQQRNQREMYRWEKLLPIKAPDVTSSRTERERDLGDAVSLRDLIRGMPALSCVVD